MAGAEYVAERVDLEQVPVVGVEPEAPDGELRVVVEIEDLLWVAHRHQPFLDHPEAEDLVGRRLVLRQSVVHVEPVKLDLLQVEAPVDENPGGDKKVIM